MRHTQLSEQRRREVDLRGVGLHDARFAHGAAQPQHRDAVDFALRIAAAAEVAHAVVGDEDDEQVAPRLRGAYPLDEAADAVVGEGEGVRHAVVEGFEGDLERFVRAQREPSREERGALGRAVDHLLGEPVAHGAVVVAPFRDGGVERHLLLPEELLPPRGVHVGGLVREVEVAAVDERGAVPLAGQRAGDRGEFETLGGQLHERRARLGGEAAQDRDLPAVGAEGVGVEIFEEEPLVTEPLQLRHDGAPLLLGLHDGAAEALQHDDDHVRTVGRQQALRGGAVGTVAAHGLEARGPFGLVEETVLVGETLLLADRREEREDGVRGGVVQKEGGREADL